MRKSVTINDNLENELKAVAKSLNVSQSIIINFAIRYFIDDFNDNIVTFKDITRSVDDQNEK